MSKITKESMFYVEANMNLDITNIADIYQVLEVSKNRKTSIRSFVLSELNDYDIIEL